MQLKLNRSTTEKKGMFGGTKVTYHLEARLHLSEEEQALFDKHGVWKLMLPFQSEVKIPHDAKVGLYGNFRDLFKGLDYKSDDLNDLAPIELALKSACQTAKAIIQVGSQYEASETVEEI